MSSIKGLNLKRKEKEKKMNEGKEKVYLVSLIFQVLGAGSEKRRIVLGAVSAKTEREVKEKFDTSEVYQRLRRRRVNAAILFPRLEFRLLNFLPNKKALLAKLDKVL